MRTPTQTAPRGCERLPPALPIRSTFPRVPVAAVRFPEPPRSVGERRSDRPVALGERQESPQIAGIRLFSRKAPALLRNGGAQSLPDAPHKKSLPLALLRLSPVRPLERWGQARKIQRQRIHWKWRRKARVETSFPVYRKATAKTDIEDCEACAVSDNVADAQPVRHATNRDLHRLRSMRKPLPAMDSDPARDSSLGLQAKLRMGWTHPRDSSVSHS